MTIFAPREQWAARVHHREIPRMTFKNIHFKKVIAQALYQGLTPRKLALTCAFGVVLGIFPVFGLTTLLCFAAAFLFRLNIPIIQTVNYVIAPLQLILILPFIKMGTYIFQLRPFPYSSDQLLEMFRNNLWVLVKEAGLALAIGVAVWLVVAIPLFLVLFYTAFWLSNQWKRNHRELKSQ